MFKKRKISYLKHGVKTPSCVIKSRRCLGHFIKASPTCDKYTVRGINKFRITNQASGRSKRNGDRRD
ncbi:unnamed protein product [Acanthoscelides obtectus]|uniref:Uncharacterized protein n=1 Tax=Acanthoscelides obtectus TaxID=200917 RepID=A0A9P0KS72_ACAOB|nr:unnamed protein product [Acanthoscelides obtectus]CAK1656132.1 hypothetical protein AOBTE_LOCUS19584 [Acanthoscelides obtectus]